MLSVKSLLFKKILEGRVPKKNNAHTFENRKKLSGTRGEEVVHHPINAI
ncbi:MAG: hypothetical protein GXO97_08805 [Nitrospirae bacterium]|nr:hypothetical protein [Nitrospirota bacterium]